MNIFISWSGSVSLEVALALRDWLPTVLQATRPYVSTEDIRKGNRWAAEIARELEDTAHGIVCLTPDNLSEPWILFEAGALSKSVESGSLWTLLMGDVNAEDIQGPLAQFQHTTFAKDDLKRLLDAINEQLGPLALEQGRLDTIFERFWPDLERQVKKAIATPRTTEAATQRSQSEVLAEVLDLSRSTAKTLADFASPGRRQVGTRSQFRTTVTLVPGQPESLIDSYLQSCLTHPAMERYAVVAGGAQGVGDDNVTDYTAVNFQSFRPVARNLLEDTAREAGVEIIDVTYQRINTG